MIRALETRGKTMAGGPQTIQLWQNQNLLALLELLKEISSGGQN
jgi:hypothetical protein